jgi:TonB family protein
MASPARRLIAPFLLAASFAHSALGQVPGRDVVGPARDLYASARYDEALAVLNDLRPADAGTAVADRKSIEQYRSLCLLALGRGTEAESAIAAVVTADPSYLPGEVEASPRVRAAFSDVRKRLLPDIANSRYGEAKAQFDRKDYATAAVQFRQVIALLDDPDMGGKLADLRTLVNGFLDLSVAATAPPPEPPKPVVAAPPPAPATPLPDPNRTYTMGDKDVSAPVVISQRMPQLTPMMKSQAKERGIVEVVIDEQGRVVNVTVRESVHPMFDAELLNVGREWKYQPAMFYGKPVRYRKMIQINVTRQN